MMTRVIVTIDGLEYTVVSEETEEHVKKSAALVDQSIAEVKASAALSVLTSTVLAAMNIADRYYKAEERNENLRAQIQTYAEECAQLRGELSRMKKNR